MTFPERIEPRPALTSEHPVQPRLSLSSSTSLSTTRSDNAERPPLLWPIFAHGMRAWLRALPKKFSDYAPRTSVQHRLLLISMISVEMRRTSRLQAVGSKVP